MVPGELWRYKGTQVSPKRCLGDSDKKPEGVSSNRRKIQSRYLNNAKIVPYLRSNPINVSIHPAIYVRFPGIVEVGLKDIDDYYIVFIVVIDHNTTPSRLFTV